MLIDAAADYDVDLSQSYMIGDRWKDIEAGHKAGCKTIFLDLNYNEDFATITQPNFTTHSLSEAAKWILS
jgi:D-glycero-D-manno-heptose 1,7-bisphosphate phosphatase